jgi:D-alanyl-lipoteichoic acid acyltransferase DltB (MBOAT superfamily)
MSFTSWQFVPFILVVLGLYYVLPHRWQNRMLLVASFVFYGAWDWRFLLLLVFTAGIDYFAALRITAAEDPKSRKRYLLLSIVSNLGVLGFFKYYNFFVGSAADLLSLIGIQASPLLLHIVLPVGISFYTFQSMSYTIDVYRRELPPIRRLTDMLLYVSYFPQLVAGPIERASTLMPQLLNERVVRRHQVAEGIWLVLWGFFKKLVIADNLATVVTQVFGATGAVSGTEVILAVYAFSFQIYCDFSGYTDIARGLAKLMGVELMLNFNLPYLARNPSDFWRRWHISLSTWLRDYLYIPLGGNRGGKWRTYRNLGLTMLLGGLWHGAAWNFVLWGGYHGALLAGHRWLTRETSLAGAWWKTRVGSFVSILIMFHLTCLGWLFFRASSIGQIGYFLRQVATDFSFGAPAARLLFPVAFFITALWVFEGWLLGRDDPRKIRGWSRGLGPLTVSVLMAMILLFSFAGSRQFIYFQF